MSGQDDRRCEQVGKYDDGSTVWHICSDDGITRAVWLPSGILPTFAESQPPTRKVVHRHAYIGDRVGWVSQTAVAGLDNAVKVEWQLSGDKIVGVRLVEDDE